MNNFIDNLISTFEIDNKEELENLIYTCITIYYYADIELVILKRNFEAKTKEEIKNSDIFDLISLITPKKKDRYKSFKTDILTTEDRRIIYHDISILKKLIDNKIINDKIIPGITDGVDKLKNLDYSLVSNKEIAIENIIELKRLIDLGIEDYLRNNIDKIIKKKHIKKYGQ